MDTKKRPLDAKGKNATKGTAKGNTNPRSETLSKKEPARKTRYSSNLVQTDSEQSNSEQTKSEKSNSEQPNSTQSDTESSDSVHTDSGRPHRVKKPPELGFSVAELHEQILMNAVLLFQPTVEDHTTWAISKGNNPLPLTKGFNIAIFKLRLSPSSKKPDYQAVLTNATYEVEIDKTKKLDASRLTGGSVSSSTRSTQGKINKTVQAARLARGKASRTAKGALEELLVETAESLTLCEPAYVSQPPRRRPGSYWTYGYPVNDPDDDE